MFTQRMGADRKMRVACFCTGLCWPVALLFATPCAFAEPAATVMDRSKQATVGVLQPGEDRESPASRNHFTMRGTGVHLHDGFLVTARHVVERDEEGRRVVPKQITIMTTDLEEATATLVGGSAFLDAVIYRIPEELATRLPVTPFSAADAAPGGTVYTVGYPMGWGPAMTFGHIGNPNTFLPTAETRLLQLDLGACSGNSGGGVFNEAGELLGIMHAIIQTDGAQQGEQRCSRFGFAIPGSLVSKIVASLVDGGQPSFSRLGVGLAATRIGNRWHMVAADVSGPARDGGLRKGDILLAIDEMSIMDGAQLKNYLIERTTPGQRVSIKVLRGQQEQVVSVTLGKS